MLAFIKKITLLFAPTKKKESTENSNDETNQKSENQKKVILDQPWVGVDLDGTLVPSTAYKGLHHVGKPIPNMLARVKDWVEGGIVVKIMTARASHPDGIAPVKKWLKKHGLPDLEVTNQKDFLMLELWDDRAIQVIEDTGKPVIGTSVLSLPKVEKLLFTKKQETEEQASKSEEDKGKKHSKASL